MGTKMAPAYANLFMGKLEEKLNELGKPHIMLWKRFIDDIFCHLDQTVCQLFFPSANYYSKNYILLSDLLGKERKKGTIILTLVVVLLKIIIS